MASRKAGRRLWFSTRAPRESPNLTELSGSCISTTSAPGKTNRKVSSWFQKFSTNEYNRETQAQVAHGHCGVPRSELSQSPKLNTPSTPKSTVLTLVDSLTSTRYWSTRRRIFNSLTCNLVPKKAR